MTYYEIISFITARSAISRCDIRLATLVLSIIHDRHYVHVLRKNETIKLPLQPKIEIWKSSDPGFKAYKAPCA